MKTVSANMSIEKHVSRLQESRENFVVGFPGSLTHSELWGWWKPVIF